MRGLGIEALTLKCVFHLSNTEGQGRIGSPDHRGWRIGSPGVISSRASRPLNTLLLATCSRLRHLPTSIQSVVSFVDFAQTCRGKLAFAISGLLVSGLSAIRTFR